MVTELLSEVQALSRADKLVAVAALRYQVYRRASVS